MMTAIPAEEMSPPKVAEARCAWGPLLTQQAVQPLPKLREIPALCCPPGAAVTCRFHPMGLQALISPGPSLCLAGRASCF